MFSFTTKLYPVTDVRISGLSHAEQVARFSAGGATLIQLREKHLSPRELYREAEEALCVAHARRARLMINDRVDIALALQADGVHLGQDDLSPSVARSLLGEGAVIGFSTHNVEQAQAAVTQAQAAEQQAAAGLAGAQSSLVQAEASARPAASRIPA